ncbi:MAG: hypothetical protein HY042_13025 [Spirochaetia bacterium]|nr:hypothetical protein [Spirochaetia bacterium]
MVTLLFVGTSAAFTASIQAQGRQESGGKEKISPLPDPPSIETLAGKSDIILKADIVSTRTYKLGGKTVGQARLRVQKAIRASQFFKLRPGEEFTVTFQMKSDELGPYFAELPENGSYVVLLLVKNVKLGGSIVGYVPEFHFPNPFSLYDAITPGVLRKVGDTP